MVAKDGRKIRNAMGEAVYVVLGGPTKAAHALLCSNSAVHLLLTGGFTHKRGTALALEAATEKAGCKVPAAELMALVPWQGPSRHPGLRTPAQPAAVAAISQARANTRQTAAATAQVRKTVRGGAKRGRVMPSGCTYAVASLTPDVIPAAAAA